MPQTILKSTPLNPDAFATGRPDRFIGTITKVRYVPWCFPNSTSGKHLLFAAIDIEPEGDSGYEPFTDHVRAGFLPTGTNQGTVPSNSAPGLPDEEREPAGHSWEDYHALAEGTAKLEDDAAESYEGIHTLGAVLRRDTEWAQWNRALGECGFQYNNEMNVTALEGLVCRFDLMPVEKKPKQVEGAPVREYTVLVPTEIISNPSAGKKGATSTVGAASKPVSAPAAASSKQATSSAAADTSGFDDELEGHIVAKVAAADGRPVLRAHLYSIPQSEYKDDKNKKTLAITRLAADDFWASRTMLKVDNKNVVTLA